MSSSPAPRSQTTSHTSHCPSTSGPRARCPLKLLDERLKDRVDPGPNDLGGGERSRLDLQGQAAQIKPGVIVEGEVESSVDPGGHRLYGAGSVRHFAS